MSKNKKDQYLTGDIEAPITYSDSNVVEENKEETRDFTLVINENKLDVKKESIPESVFTNYVKVKIVGRHQLAGIRMMSIVKIGKIILENNDGMYSVITSPSTANLVKRVIRERSDLLGTTLPLEYREKRINTFDNGLKRFKF